MGAKLKELKKAKRIFRVEETHPFIMALNKLQQPTRGDEKRLDEVEEVLKQIFPTHAKVVDQFFTENNLKSDECIDHTHPLFREFNEFYNKEIPEPKFPEFTEAQWQAVSAGVALSRGEKKLLEFWLLKK